MPPRKRNKENQGLPKRWRFTHGAYYYQVPPGFEHLWDGKKQFRLGKSLSEAHRTYAERIQLDESTIQTIGDALDRYALEVVPDKAPKTQRENQSAIKRLKAVFGHMRPAEFKPVHAYGYRDRRGKIAPTAANRELEVLSHAFTKMIEWGALESHPMIEGKFKKMPSKPRSRYVEDWEVIECLDLPATRKRGSVKMVQAYIKLKLLTGMRRTDLLRLRTSDITDEGIYNRPSKTEHSSGKSTLYEWDEAGQLKAVYNECLATRPVDISPFLFCTRRGESYYNETKGAANGFDSIWQRFMDRVVAETQVADRFWEKDLRAKCATDADTLEHARALLTHASAATTNRIYRRKAEKVQIGKGVKE